MSLRTPCTTASCRPASPGGRTDPQGQGGQILVVFAGGLITLILMVGLVIDAGNAFLNRRDGQNAADLAAMAGTKIVADYYVKAPGLTSADVYDAISARMSANNCSASGGTPCTWTASFIDRNEAVLGPVVASASGIPYNAQGVIVHVSRQPRTYFLGLVGQTNWTVATDATALTARTTAAPPGGLLPIGTNPPQPYQTNREYTLTDGYGPGQFGWLSWTGANATGILARSICYPDNPAMTFPVWIPGEPGAHNGSDVRACLDGWIASGATVLIPVFDACQPCNGNNAKYNVTGLAAFVLTGYDGSGPAITTVRGRFVQYSGLTSVGAGSLSGPPAAGDPTFFLGLVR